jgi:hypothetical protein
MRSPVTYVVRDLGVVDAQRVLADPRPHILEDDQRDRDQRVHGDADAADADLSPPRSVDRSPSAFATTAKREPRVRQRANRQKKRARATGGREAPCLGQPPRRSVLAYAALPSVPTWSSCAFSMDTWRFLLASRSALITIVSPVHSVQDVGCLEYRMLSLRIDLVIEAAIGSPHTDARTLSSVLVEGCRSTAAHSLPQ